MTGRVLGSGLGMARLLGVHKVFGRVGAKMSQHTPKYSNLGTNSSEYFMNRQVYLFKLFILAFFNYYLI